MADTYTATLLGPDSADSVELELIQGEPQRSFTRTVDVNGVQVDEVWELDPDAGEPTYRPGGFEGRDYS